MNNYHTSVLLKETIDYLRVEPGKKYIDATLGGGGHTGTILEQGGKVLGIDVDQDALNYVEAKFKVQSEKSKIGEDLFLARGNFREIERIAKENGFENVAGIVFDLGVSSHQFDTAERGFSIQKEGPLDMRMDQSLEVKADSFVNVLSKQELIELFTELGEERFAKLIADGIVKARKAKAITTTKELADLVRKAVPRHEPGFHPATRVFQALRIAVNDEQNSLREALPKAIKLLESGGRLAIISFHSLEDRIVKNLFKEFESEGIGRIITDKPVVPSESEVAANPRSRSAKLRVIEKSQHVIPTKR